MVPYSLQPFKAAWRGDGILSIPLAYYIPPLLLCTPLPTLGPVVRYGSADALSTN
jgi:hypothetical protein